MKFGVLFGSSMVLKFLSWDMIIYLLYTFILLMSFKLWEWSYVGMSWKFGGDLVSLALLCLTLWIFGMMFMGSKKEEMSGNSFSYKLLLLLILISLFSSFTQIDLLMFYIFFELVLIPMFLFIIMFGYQPERLLSGIFMIFYTVFGSLPLLSGLIWVKSNEGSLNYIYLLTKKESCIEIWNLLLSMAFSIKLPVYGVHVWLPKAHVEAPVTGSMILAGLLLKLGGYGLLRILPLLKLSFMKQSFFSMLSIWGGLMCGFICLRQLDLKKLIAYSSVVHMGLLTGGLMTYKSSCMYGGFIVSVGHGLCSSGLFYMANMLYVRVYSRSILLLKGIMSLMPSLMMWNFFLNLGNMAAPPFLNIFGEISLGSGLIDWNKSFLLLLMLMFFVSVFYSIYMYSFMSHGKYQFSKMGEMVTVIEFLIISMHSLPMLMLVLKLESFSWA